MWIALASAGALVAAAWLDRGHDLRADYVSWLSHGPYGWLAAAGVLGLGASCLLAGIRLGSTLPEPWDRSVATALACAAALSLATVALPSRGFGEPVWRTVAHVAIAVGAYACVAGSAAALAWLAAQRRVHAPWSRASAGLILAGLAGVAAASARVQLAGGRSWRGLAQLGLVLAAAVWLSVASRARRAAP